ncbi:MAG: hypothetical protein HIU91_09930 [Acidobacteria bacterium]|nr:hypothetical protein [Acidobacteriota bacterium]
MLHKNALPHLTPVTPSLSIANPNNLHLMPSASAERSHSAAPHRVALLILTARRCSAFFAEAAVLVLVFGILDYFMLKGRIEIAWILLALGASLGLLAASIATDFAVHHWVKAHP